MREMFDDMRNNVVIFARWSSLDAFIDETHLDVGQIPATISVQMSMWIL